MARVIIVESRTVITHTLRRWCQDLGRWLAEEISTHGAVRAADRLEVKAREREQAAPAVPAERGVRETCDRTTARLRRCAAWLRERAEEVDALTAYELRSAAHGLPALSKRVLPPHGARRRVCGL